MEEFGYSLLVLRLACPVHHGVLWSCPSKENPLRSKNSMLSIMLKPINKKINPNIRNTKKPQFWPFQTWHARTKCWSFRLDDTWLVELLWVVGTSWCFPKLAPKVFVGSWDASVANRWAEMLDRCDSKPAALSLSPESFNPYSMHDSICLLQVILIPFEPQAHWLPPCHDFCGVNNQESQHAGANGMQQ